MTTKNVYKMPAIKVVPVKSVLMLSGSSGSDDGNRVKVTSGNFQEEEWDE